MIFFIVIDKEKNFTIDSAEFQEDREYFKELIKEDWIGTALINEVSGYEFYIGQGGDILLGDNYGNFVECPKGRFTIIGE